MVGFPDWLESQVTSQLGRGTWLDESQVTSQVGRGTWLDGNGEASNRPNAKIQLSNLHQSALKQLVLDEHVNFV